MKKRFFVILMMMLIGIVSVQAQDVTLRYFMWDPSFEEIEQEMVNICATEF
jgi:hypothetical protein